MHKWEAIEV